MNVILPMLLGLSIFGFPLAFAEKSMDSTSSVSEDSFDIGRFSYLPYGVKFYQYEYQPFGVLSSESFSRCYFTADFVLGNGAYSDSGHVTYKFPKDMRWPGGYDNSTFYVVRSPSFNFPEDNHFEKIIPSKDENGNRVLEFNLVLGLNTFVANHTLFWDSQKSKMIDCPNPLEFKKQEYGYYDFVYPLKIQQTYSDMLGFEEPDFLCKPDLVYVQKYDGSPACVKSESKKKLIERGWTEKKISHSDNPLQQKWALTTNGEISSVDISEDDSIIAIGTKISDTQKGMLYLLGDDSTLLWNKEFDSMISNVGISNNTILVNGFHVCGGGGGARTYCNYTADVFDIQGNKRYNVTHNDMTAFGTSLSPNGSQIITHTYDVLNYFNIKE
ncbi:MAG: hypothetical protein PVG23_06860, partial [Nitrosopumilaceae archaeon]